MRRRRATSRPRAIDDERLLQPGGTPSVDRGARKIRQKRFVLDCEAVVLGVDGISDFDALHSRKHDDEVHDILAEGGDDLSKLPLSIRKRRHISTVR